MSAVSRCSLIMPPSVVSTVEARIALVCHRRCIDPRQAFEYRRGTDNYTEPSRLMALMG